MSPRLWQAVNVAVLVVVLAANGLAGSGGLSGESIGVIANRYPSAFLPAGWTFGIWSLIYVGLLGFVVHQALPAQRASGFVERVGPWWAVNGLLNVGWIVAFSFSRFGTALVLMVALLVTLIVLVERLGAHREGISRGDRVLGAWPFALYLAWISVALIANTFQYAHVVGWDGWGIPERVWAVLMMSAATALGLAMVMHRGLWVFPLVVAWALAGIGARHAGDPLLASAAWGLAATGLVGLGAVLGARRYRRPGEAPGS